MKLLIAGLAPNGRKKQLEALSVSNNRIIEIMIMPPNDNDFTSSPFCKRAL